MGILADRILGERPSSVDIQASVDRVRHFLEGVPGVWRVYVFGSCADGTFSCTSDLDIGIVFDSQQSYVEQRSTVLRARIDTILPWEPVMLVKERFLEQRESGGLSYEIYRRGKLIYESRTNV